MRPSSESGASVGRRSTPWSGLLPLVIVILVSAFSWYFLRTMGTLGLVVLSGAMLATAFTMVLIARYPIAICMIWFLSMSGMQAVGIMRMPGLPDFSLARLFMVMVMLLGAVAVVTGRQLLRAPHLPGALLMIHALYVLANMYMGGVDSRFNTWMASSFAPVVGFMFAKDFIYEDKHLRAIMLTFVAISVYFWITCVGEKLEIPALVWPRVILDRDFGISWFGRSRGPFLQPGLTGQFLGWFMMAHVFLLTRRISGTFKILLMANLVFCGIGLFLTYTRGPWLATVLGFMAMAVLRPSYRKMFAGVLVVGMLMVATNALRPKNNEFLGERLNNTSTIENRLGFLAAATRMIHDRPFFGIGYFRYMELLPEYNQGTYIPMYGFVARGAGAEVPIHDIYIGRAAEEGLVSIALFFALMAVLYRHFWKRWRGADAQSWFDRDFLALYAGIMVSYFVNGMTLDYRYFDFVNVLPFFMSGIVVGYPWFVTSRDNRMARMSKWRDSFVRHSRPNRAPQVAPSQPVDMS